MDSNERDEKILEALNELKTKVPSIIDLFDEFLEHQNKFKDVNHSVESVNHNLEEIREQLRIVKILVDNLACNRERIKQIVEDDNNTTSFILLLRKIVAREEKSIKTFLGDIIVSKKKEFADCLLKDFETKVQLYIGRKILNAGAILSIITAAITFIITYFTKG